MTQVYKILGQVATTDTTEKVLYSAPAATQTIVTNITATNRNGSSQTFDVNVYNSAPDVSSVITPTFVSLYGGSNSTTAGSYSYNGTSWTSASRPSSYLSCVTYGNNKFVAVGYGNTTSAYSTDGITWTLGTTATTVQSNLYALVAASPTTFVALSTGTSTDAQSSTDGITWTLRTLPASASWRTVAYVNTYWYALSNSTAAAISVDGTDWIIRTMPSSVDWSAMTYGNGTYIAVARTSTAGAISNNGFTWTAMTMPTDSYWNGLAYGNGTFVASAVMGSGYTETAQAAATSTDGTTWTTRTMPAVCYWGNIAFGNGLFVCTSPNSTNAASSTDGITWTLRANTSNASMVVYGNPSIGYSSPAVNNIYKNNTLAANASQVLTPGITLGAGNSIVVKGTSNTTFSVYGTELS